MFWKDIEPRLKKDYIDTGKGEARVSRLPLMQIHPEALLSAMAVNCAGEQGKYWQYHDKVFREQYNKGDDCHPAEGGGLKK
jgi:protein-disulfide isomerase